MSKPKQSRISTSTSAFGTSGRINHDATPFYNSRLYQNLPQEEKTPYIEENIPVDQLNRIYNSTSESMFQIPDNSVHLMVTSPPYNVGKEYDEDLTLAEYLLFLKNVWREVKRVLIPGGRACINVANLGRKPYIPLHAFILRDMLELGFLMRGEIIWNKAASASASTAWGSWLSATNPTLRDVHEYILVFSKSTYKRQNPDKKESTILRDEFLECSKSIWTFPAESAKKIGHPAPFPLELPRRLILLYSFAGDVILDPFMGSGQTAIASLATGRHYLGYEIDQEYLSLAEERIQQYKAQNS